LLIKKLNGGIVARETKQDRTVRGMIDQTTEHIFELKNMEANPNSKESDVERWCQSFLKNCLGFTASAGYSIRSQEAKGKMRPDLVLLKGDKPIIVIEVKKFGYDLNKSDFRSGKVQLNEYLNSIGAVNWGILTNGTDWKLYDFSDQSVGGIEVTSFDVKGESDAYDTSKKAIEETCYNLLEFHETTYVSGEWTDLSKEATAFSPESIARAILCADVVKYIARTIRGEHEYKANLEVLTDKIYSTLEQGLNDAIKGWNEAKAAEFSKYIKSQKRVSRKSRKKRTDKVVAEGNQPVVESPAVVADANLAAKTETKIAG
jgi:hypothetical protein